MAKKLKVEMEKGEGLFHEKKEGPKKEKKEDKMEKEGKFDGSLKNYVKKTFKKK